MASKRASRRSHTAGNRARRWLLQFAVVATAVAIGAWSAYVIFVPPSQLHEVKPEYLIASAEPGTIESVRKVTAEAEWVRTGSLVNRSTGVVTSVRVGAEDVSNSGHVAYEVDLRPVRVAEGDVPSFRQLTLGDSGPDVLQLIRMLKALGYYGGQVDDRFGPKTLAAVRAMQADDGLEIDGVVRPGDVLYMSGLPRKLLVNADVIAPGRTVVGGEEALWVLSSEPKVTLTLNAEEADMLSEETRVLIELQGHERQARVAARAGSSDQSADSVSLVLASDDGRPICAEGCQGVPSVGVERLPARIEIEPTLTGIVVPTAAIRTGRGGSTSVVDSSGRTHRVVVRGGARGMTVVDGVKPGLRVRAYVTASNG